jgi:glycerol-3-phosphate acyltransferase PlsX
MTDSTDYVIAIDAMGGDYGPEVTVPASLDIIKRYKNLRLILVGDEYLIRSQMQIYHCASNDRLIVQHASQRVDMDEQPIKALRTKKDSSMRVAINLVKEKKADACVSAGNTGALMMIAKFVLKALSGIDRPAILVPMPTYDTNKFVYALDLGANVDSTAENLYQFAIMGTVLSACIDNVKYPKIGLLNIGEEEIKGNEQVKHTAQILSESKHINYYGYIEGDDIFTGIVDVVVCDGFVGNVALKCMEGISKLINFYTKRAFKSFYGFMVSLIGAPILKKLKKQLDPGRSNGASLLGLQGIVIKSHGNADRKSYANAIKAAILQVEKNVPQRIGEEVAKILQGDKK